MAKLAALPVAILAILAGPNVARAGAVGLFDTQNRFLEGAFPPAVITPSRTTIDSFESPPGTDGAWLFGSAVTHSFGPSHATDGASAIAVVFQDPASPQCFLEYNSGGSGWGNGPSEAAVALSLELVFNDQAALSVYNPQGVPVTLVVSMGKVFTFSLTPGANQILMPTRQMARDVYRSTTVLQDTRFTVQHPSAVTLYFDDFHWVGPGLGENLVQHAARIDFGGGRYLRPFFAAVAATSPYSAAAGAGWETPTAAGEDSIYSARMCTYGSSGRQPHDQLIRDSVFNINSPLLVNLPPGTYRLHVVPGNIFVPSYHALASDFALSVRVEGQEHPLRGRGADRPERIRFLYGEDRLDYAPGQDIWRTYLEPTFHPLECDVTTSTTPMRLEFLSSPPGHAQLCFLIVYPVSSAAAVEPEIAALWDDIRDRFNELVYMPATQGMVDSMHLPGQCVDGLALYDPPGSGFRVFAQPYADDVFPHDPPAAAEIAQEIVAASPPGEIEPLAVGVYALQALQGLSVQPGAFSGPAGSTIGPERCDVRFVRYSYRMPGQQSHGDWRYTVLPWYLVKRSGVDVPAGMSVRFWIDVDVPAEAPPGRYTASALVRVDNAPAQTIALHLDVLPLVLDQVPGTVRYVTVYGQTSRWAPLADVSWSGAVGGMAAAERDAFYQDCATFSAQRYRAEFELMRRSGITHAYHLAALSDTRVPLTPELTGGLPVVYMSTANVQAEWAARDFLGPLAELTEGAVATSRAAGQQPIQGLFDGQWELFTWGDGYQNFGDTQQESGTYRFQCGFLMWRLGVEGILFDVWFNAWGHPYHPFDGHSGEWGSLCFPASHDWPTLNPSVVLQGIREGIEDYRYLITLERLVAQNLGTPAAADGRAYLDQLRASINGDASYYFYKVGPKAGHNNTWKLKDTAWSGADYRAARDNLAQLIAAFTSSGVIPPTVVTNDATSVTSTSATLNGSLTSTGGATTTPKIHWGYNDAGTGAWDTVVDLGAKAAGAFWTDVTGLSGSTAYYYRASATNSAGTSWGVVKSFTTPAAAARHVKINCGTDSFTPAGWEDDSAYVSGGADYDWSGPISAAGVPGAAPEEVYQTVRHMTPHQYTIPLASGPYILRLHLCDLYGGRDVRYVAEGQTLAAHLDYATAAGGLGRAVALDFSVVLADGILTIECAGAGSYPDVFEAGIEVIPVSFPDSDLDGMDDDWELAHFGDLSHDGAADSEADGLTDLEEFQVGTDPLAADTDQDGLPDGADPQPLSREAEGADGALLSCGGFPPGAGALAWCAACGCVLAMRRRLARRRG